MRPIALVYPIRKTTHQALQEQKHANWLTSGYKSFLGDVKVGFGEVKNRFSVIRKTKERKKRKKERKERKNERKISTEE